MTEIIPIVDENDQVISSVAKDKFDKTTGAIYRTVSLFLFNKKGQILIQRRAFSKKTYAGKWDFAAVAGHVAFGENYLEAIQRETDEELGLKNIDFFEVEKSFTKTKDGKRRFTQVFWAVGDFSLDDLQVPKSEIAEVKLISLTDLKEMFVRNPDDFALYDDVKILSQRFSRIAEIARLKSL